MTLRMMTVITARITGTLYDDQTLAVYAIDGVLLPKELFVDGLDPPTLEAFQILILTC